MSTSLGEREAPPPCDVRVEGLALEHLHDDVRLARLEVAGVEGLDDVRIGDVARGGRLAQEARDDVGVREHLCVKQLEGAPVLGQLVLHLVDRAHPALAEQTDDPELPRDDRPFG